MQGCMPVTLYGMARGVMVMKVPVAATPTSRGSTTGDLEVRLCADQDKNNEDAPIELVELYIQ